MAYGRVVTFDPDQPECTRCHESMDCREMGEWSDDPELCVCNDCAQTLLAEFKEEIRTLRELLFAEHTCMGKYGDDGERQCGMCRIDFRLDPIGKIVQLLGERNTRNAVEWARKQG